MQDIDLLPPRMRNKVVVDGNGHWLWNAARNGGGAPVISMNGRALSAKRVAYEWVIGTPGMGKLETSCGEQRCINPRHHRGEHAEPATRITIDEGWIAGLPIRICRWIVPEPNTGCWIWTGAAVPVGDHYGHLTVDYVTVMSHRFIFEHFGGLIPEGFHLHHKCGVSLCCNPDHLEPISASDHSRITRLGALSKSAEGPEARLYEAGVFLSDVARFVGVGTSTITRWRNSENHYEPGQDARNEIDRFLKLTGADLTSEQLFPTSEVA